MASSTNPTQSQIQQMIIASANQYGVDPSLALGVAQTESNFNPNAISPVGAIGVMQLMPATAASLGVDPYDPQQNIDGGVRLLSRLLNQYGGNVQQALWAYNAGPGSVASGTLPTETANYIPAVLANAQNFSGVIPPPSDLLQTPDLSAANTSPDLSGQVTVGGLTMPTTYAIAGGIILFGLIASAIRD